MEHRVRFTLTDELVAETTAAVQRAWSRPVWVGSMVLIGAIGVLLLVLGNRSWLAGFPLGVATLGLIMQYVSPGPRRATLERLQAQVGSPIEVSLSEAGVAVTSRVEYPWRAVRQVHRFHRLWLLWAPGGAYLMLPLDAVEEGAQALVVAKVEEHGGRIEDRR